MYGREWSDVGQRQFQCSRFAAFSLASRHLNDSRRFFDHRTHTWIRGRRLLAQSHRNTSDKPANALTDCRFSDGRASMALDRVNAIPAASNCTDERYLDSGSLDQLEYQVHLHGHRPSRDRHSVVSPQGQSVQGCDCQRMSYREGPWVGGPNGVGGRKCSWQWQRSTGRSGE